VLTPNFPVANLRDNRSLSRVAKLHPMNTNQVQSLIRSVLLTAGAGLVTKGLTDQAGLEQLIGGVLSLASIVWSQLHHKNAPPTP